MAFYEINTWRGAKHQRGELQGTPHPEQGAAGKLPSKAANPADLACKAARAVHSAGGRR